MKSFLIIIMFFGLTILTLRKIILFLDFIRGRNMIYKVLDAKDYLIDNKDELIKLFKDKYKNQLNNGKVYTGFQRQVFIEHLNDSIKQSIREFITSKFGLNAEQTMLVEADELIKPVINDIIEGSLL